jgi:hypothetical protein
MTAALKPDLYPNDARTTLASGDRHSPPPSSRKNGSNGSTVKPLSPTARPAWLSLLFALKRVSGYTTLLLLAALLPVYGWSAITQHSWGKTYSKLQKLQQAERQLTTKTEVRAYQVAEQAERQPKGLVPQTPKTTIFLNPARAAGTPTKTQSKTPLPKATASPISY